MSATPTQTPDVATADLENLRKAIASTPRPEPATPLSAVMAFGWRGYLKIKHVPEQLIDVTMTPVLFTVMFVYMYGGAISGSTGEYLEYIMPGILAMSVLFTTVYSGVVLNTDMTKGVVDRYRSMPIKRWAPLVGALLGDAMRYVVAGTVAITIGLILGYSPDGGVTGVALAVVLVAAFAFGMSWIFTTLGLIMRSPQAVMNTGFMALFPLLFISNAFVPVDTLPNGLTDFVDVNPISHIIDAARGLLEDDRSGGDILLALGEAALMTAVFAPLTLRLYNKA